MKKLLSFTLALVLCLSLLSACGNSNNVTPSSGNPGQSNTPEKSVELVMTMISFGLNLEDAEKVEAAINAHIEPLVGATLDIEWIDMGDYVNQMNLKFTGGEQIDIMATFGAMASLWYAQDALLPVTDLIEQYGQGIIESVGRDILKAGYINGDLYVLPTVSSFARENCLFYRKDIADKYNIDFSGVSSLADLTPILEKLHAAEPGMNLLIANNPTDPMLVSWDWDALGDEYGVLMNYADSLEVTNLFTSEQYKDLVTTMHKWYEAGYVQKDATTTTDNIATLMSSGNSFGWIGNNYPGYPEQQTVSCGCELGTVKLTEAVATSATASTTVLAVTSTSKNPDKAMQVLNLLYTDPVLINLLAYGIEGEHYQFTDAEAGYIGFVDGLDMMTTKYVNKLTIGNGLLYYLEAGNPADLNEATEVFNETATVSKAMGFTYDSAAVSNQLAAVENVAAKYRKGLESGALDPETELPKFIAELESAGINDIIAAKQEQLNAWAALNGVK